MHPVDSPITFEAVIEAFTGLERASCLTDFSNQSRITVHVEENVWVANVAMYE
jgi:hypothetical protein